MAVHEGRTTMTCTATPASTPATALQVWHGDTDSEMSDVVRLLPLRDESFVRVSPGVHVMHYSLVAADDVAILSARLKGDGIGVSVVKPSYVGFALPVSPDNSYILNGAHITQASIYLASGGKPLYIRGKDRQTLAAILPADRFLRTVMALKGVYDNALDLRGGFLDLPATAARGAFNQLQALGSRHQQLSAHFVSRDFAESVFAIMVDAYMMATPGDDRRHRRLHRMSKVVRRAEEYFMATRGRQVSLADLCLAAGVGSTSLYMAFEQLCGESPLAYFRKRQLCMARRALMQAQDRHGAVKRAALNAGLTHAGRFSVEYRQLFGESPSTTLSLSHH